MNDYAVPSDRPECPVCYGENSHLPSCPIRKIPVARAAKMARRLPRERPESSRRPGRAPCRVVSTSSARVR